MHQITGIYFYKDYVVYSTHYAHGFYRSMHNRKGLSDEQARCAFIVEHSHEVDHLISTKPTKEGKFLTNIEHESKAL